MASKNIIFIDSRVSNYQSLIDSLTEPAEVFLLDGASDGLSQMAALLQGHTGIDAIHVISHGSVGALYLGSTVLDSGVLDSYGSQLASIGNALMNTGDILLYGCNLAQGDVGLQFITSLAQVTGADVAGSSNATGAAALGGDWVLERSAGNVETKGFQISGLIGLLAGSSVEIEPNNSVATANALALSTPVIGQITTSSDSDYYKVPVAGSGILSLTIDVPTDSTLDYYKLGLYSSTGSLVSTFTTGKDQTFQTPVSAKGDYYIGVGSSTYYSGDGPAVNQYRLTVESTAIETSLLGKNLTGTASNESFTGGTGNDTIDAGPGTDTVIFTGTRADHSVTKTATGWTVSSPADGTDSLQNVERLQFSNETLALDINGVAGQAYRIYQAAFNRTPDNGGLKYWVSRMDGGTTQDRVAAEFVGSQEFQNLYGANPTNADFLTKLYSNVLHRTPDPGGYNWWLGQLDAGAYDKTSALASFAESPENQAGVIGVIQNGIDLFI